MRTLGAQASRGACDLWSTAARYCSTAASPSRSQSPCCHNRLASRSQQHASGKRLGGWARRAAKQVVQAEQHAQEAGAAFQALLQLIGELYASSL